MVRAAEVLPPPPSAYFNDYAGVVDAATASSLNGELADFERQTSNQIVVAVFPTMQSDSSVEDYTVRLAQSWHVGQKVRDNGAVLFVFVQSHQVYIQVGYGLEGAIPDALAKTIVSDEITPAFRAGNFGGGLTAGVHALMAAAKGEYHGTGRTQAEANDGSPGGHFPFLFAAFLVLLVVSHFINRRRGAVYQSSGRRWVAAPAILPPFMGGGGGLFGGGSGSGGGGGFSGGGGSFGGGGAGGSWKLVRPWRFSPPFPRSITRPLLRPFSGRRLGRLGSSPWWWRAMA
jgi:uncharacterized protein